MFGFIGVGVVNLLYAIPLQCVSMSYQEFKVRSAIINININEPLFYP